MANDRAMIQALIDTLLPETISEKFQTEERLRKNENTTLGVAISIWTEWDGIRIMEVFEEALDDANFHSEAAEVAKWIELLKKDDMTEYYAYMEKLSHD